jgi:hypothetical protein
VTERFDQLGVVSDVLAQLAALSVGVANPLFSENLRSLGQVKPLPWQGGLDLLLGGHSLERVLNRQGQKGSAPGGGFAEYGVHQLIGETRPHGIVNGHEIGFFFDKRQGAGDGIMPLFPTFADLHIHKSQVSAIAAAKNLLVFLGHYHDTLADIVPGHKELGGPQPNRAAIERGKGLLLSILEPARLPRRR